MDHQLKVALIQSDLVWENPEENRINFTNKITGILEDVDLIVLPEMFTSGFTMNAKRVAEPMKGDTVKWMQTIANQKHCAIMGSVVIRENDAFFNRGLFVHPNGHIDHYDKHHTFTLAGEHQTYSAGKKQVIINYKDWKICPLICYDLRFPVWARNTHDYELLIYVANWPKTRVDAWDTLLRARAIENMSYCIGVNRVGFDGNNHEYVGHSAAYNVLGRQIDDLEKEQESISIVSLDKSELNDTREKLGFLKDRDVFTLEVE